MPYLYGHFLSRAEDVSGRKEDAQAAQLLEGQTAFIPFIPDLLQLYILSRTLRSSADP